MEDEEVGRIRPGMEVRDIGGNKIGTVDRIYRPVLATPGGAAAGLPAGEEVLEVKTGFLGLGERLCIPRSAFREVIRDCAFLAESREALEAAAWHDWHTKASYLDEER